MRPTNETELAEAVRDATGPLAIRGGGTRPVGRPVAGELLETAGLAGVRLYEPGALTLVAGAGTPLAEVKALLADEGQCLPFEPMDHRKVMGTGGVPTLGGMVAANVSGPRRVQAGACRDSLIGVRFVDGSGAVVKNGGRVMKNVTGYDLVKLMAGSRGTLGVLSEVAFKLLPAPATRASVLINGASDEDAVAAMATALGSPYEVSGAAHISAGAGGHAVTMLRIEGFADSVSYRAAELKDLMARFGEVSLESDPEKVASDWAWVRDVGPFHGRAGDVWRLSVKPSEAPGIIARAGGEALLDWGGGLIWLRLPEGSDLRAALGRFDGHATLVRGSEATRARIAPFHPDPAPVAALATAIRAKFDPRRILNPGLMD